MAAALRDDAAVEAERRLAEANETARRIAADTTPPQDPEPRLAAARREARERIAAEDWLDSRTAIEDREEWMRLAIERARARLIAPEPPADRRARLARLATEALAALPGDELVVALAPEDAAIVDAAWAAALRPGARVTVEVVPEAAPAGCTVRTADGRISSDNGVDARLRRFESACRVALGRIYGR
jgi:vacuolar-type H+-ATPase subunit E/Vma4